MMKRLLLIIVAVLSLQTVQRAKAKGESRDFPLHMKYEGIAFVMDSPMESLLDNLLTDNKGKNTLYHGSTLIEADRQEDYFGNYHVIYSQEVDGKKSNYQMILHFHPDGMLYYVNGMLAVEPVGTAGAKAVIPATKITAEQASTVATGSPQSITRPFLVSYQDSPRETYEVLDSKRLCLVYVDVYSGEILYTQPMLHSYASWNDLDGSPVTLPAQTSYNGLQDMQLMQTDGGYILRDPERKILTIDSSNRLDNYKSSEFPKTLSGQAALLAQKGEDFLFADEEQLLDAKYSTAIKSIAFNIHYTSDMPKSANIHIYYVDDNDQPMDDILNIDLDDIEWELDSYILKSSYELESAIDVDLYSFHTQVDITLDGNVFSGKDIIIPGNGKYCSMSNPNRKWMGCLVLASVCASQPGVDVHWGVQKTYDMYSDYFGIRGCDNKGTQIINVINPPNTMTGMIDMPENAMAMTETFTDHYGDSSFMMLYGMGLPHVTYPFVSLATIAHEYTHNVEFGLGKMLVYKNESGALNEAMADCMSQVAIYYVTGKPSWQDKEMSLKLDNLRNFSDPWYSGSINGNISDNNAQPKYYGGRYWIDYTKDSFDSGGVHFNSGVFNHLFYLLCEGGMGMTNEKNETRDIYPIGIDSMKDILFHSMRYYNSTLCTYNEIADNLMVVVEDLNGQDNDMSHDLQRKMQEAFSHVGMTSGFTPDGIEQVNLQSDRQTLYNLLGQPVGDSYKGVVIRNGKTVVTK